MLVYLLIALLILVIFYFLYIYNNLIKLTNNIQEAFSSMDVYLKKRWDLVPNLVETVKGYAKHEKTTLEEITKLRNNSYDEMDINDKIRTNKKLNNEIKKIMAISENYPDLKANVNFLNLSNTMLKVEEDIANSRKYYNAVIKRYNNKVEMIPSNIVAKILGYKTKEMFSLNEKEKEEIKVGI